jgi:hypothetical protein
MYLRTRIFADEFAPEDFVFALAGNTAPENILFGEFL